MSLRSTHFGAWLVASACLIASAFTHAAPPNETKALHDAEIGDSVMLPAFQFSSQKRFQQDVHLKRIRIRKPGSQTWVVSKHGKRALPTSQTKYFISEPGKTGTRMHLSLDSDATSMKATVFSGNTVHHAAGTWDGKAFHVKQHRTETLNHNYRCDSSSHPKPTTPTRDHETSTWNIMQTSLQKGVVTPTQQPLLPSLSSTVANETPQPHLSAKVGASGGQYEALIAVDTDYQFLQEKFGGVSDAHVTLARDYMDQLFIGMNVIYGRDLDVTLVRGETFFYESDDSDPYPSLDGSDAYEQLQEVSNYWATDPEKKSISRAFVALLSGKGQAFTNYEFSGGVAWVLNQGNYCQATGQLRDDGRNYDGHFSASQVRTLTQSHIDDIALVAHEIGHNFGATHSHCTETSPGSGQFLDQCSNAEAYKGCYDGNQSCPLPSSNPWGSSKGSLMSYCHQPDSDGNGGECGQEDQFHPVISAFLQGRVAYNVQESCLTTTANQPPVFSSSNYTPLIQADLTNGSTVTSVQANDPDEDSVIFSISSGNNDSAFSIINTGTNTAQVRVNDSSRITSGTRSLTVTASDGRGGTDTATVTITITAPAQPLGEIIFISSFE